MSRRHCPEIDNIFSTQKPMALCFSGFFYSLPLSYIFKYSLCQTKSSPSHHHLSIYLFLSFTHRKWCFQFERFRQWIVFAFCRCYVFSINFLLLLLLPLFFVWFITLELLSSGCFGFKHELRSTEKKLYHSSQIASENVCVNHFFFFFSEDTVNLCGLLFGNKTLEKMSNIADNQKQITRNCFGEIK